LFVSWRRGKTVVFALISTWPVGVILTKKRTDGPIRNEAVLITISIGKIQKKSAKSSYTAFAFVML
jgi:hypothetical protein